LGGRHEAKDVESLRERGIDCILNLAPRECGASSCRGYPQDWTTLDLDAKDALDHNIFEDVVPRAMEFIEQCLMERRCVFVHCFAGMNRSATVCAAWMLRLLKTQGGSVSEVVWHLATHRGLVLQNLTFNEGLVTMARAEARLR